MDEWLDRGLFCVTWIGMMWTLDAIMSNTGIISYGSLMAGALTITALGLFRQYRASVVKR